MTDIIKVVDLNKKYVNDEVVTPVLHGVTFSVKKGSSLRLWVHRVQENLRSCISWVF